MRYGLALLFFAASIASTPAAVAQEVFEFQTLGLKIAKPVGWHVLTDARNRWNISRLKMKDAQFQKLVQKHARPPIFAVTKFPEPHDDLNPSFKINARPAGRITPENLVPFANRIVQFVAGKMGKVIEIEPAEPLEISGYPAAYASFDYVLQTQGGPEFRTRSQIWLILKGDLVFLAGAGTRLDEANGKRTEIQAIIASIRLE